MILTLKQLKTVLNEVVLLESRKQDVWRKYISQDLENRWNAIDWDTGEGEENVTRGEDHFYRTVQRGLNYLDEDGSSFPMWDNTSIAKNSKNKYLEWMMDQFISHNEPPNELVNTVVEFEKYRHISPRDIWHYKTLGELRAAIEGDAAKRLAKIKVSSDQYDKVYEDEHVFVVHPKTKEAAQKYGAGTRWCISATKSENYFDEYDERGAVHYFVIRKQPVGDEWDKISVTAEPQNTCDSCGDLITDWNYDIDECIGCNASLDEKEPGYTTVSRGRPTLTLFDASDTVRDFGDAPWQIGIGLDTALMRARDHGTNVQQWSSKLGI